jgi:hypothetical protein
MQHRRISLLARGALALTVLGVLAPAGTSGQVSPDTLRLTITGVVYDRESGAPIPGALIRFGGDTAFRATAGDDGRYTIVGLLRGTYPMEVDAVGYTSLHGDLNLQRSGELNIPMEPVAGGQPGGRPSRIVGRVLERETGNPVAGAEITLAGRSPSLISDGQGRFEIGQLSPGLHVFSVQYLGRAPAQAQVEVPREGTLDVEIRLALKPVELAPMVVTATPRNSYLEDMGFYRRRDAGLSGRQITRQTLMEMAPRSLAEVLVTVPGLRVVPAELGRFQVRMRRAISLGAGGGDGCSPALFIDDIRSEIGWFQDLDPARVEALEIYTGANAPLRYNDPCGVILVWTRRGGRERGRG